MNRSRALLALAATALLSARSEAVAWRSARFHTTGTNDERQWRFHTETGVSFLYYNAAGHYARSYTDGEREVVLIGRSSNYAWEKSDTLSSPVDFPAIVTARLDIIRKGAAWEYSSLEDAARRLAESSVSTHSAENTWPPGSFIAVSSASRVYYSQTKSHWVVWTVGPDMLRRGQWEYQFMRASLSQDLDELSRREGLREPIPMTRARRSPGAGSGKEFVGSSGLVFEYEGELESRVRGGVERVWLYPVHAPSSREMLGEVNVIEPDDFEHPERFAAKGLSEITVTAKDDGVPGLAELRNARLAELDRAGVAYSTSGWVPCGSPKHWPSGSFALNIERPYVLSEFHTQNERSAIRVVSGVKSFPLAGGIAGPICGISRYVADAAAKERVDAAPDPVDPRAFPRDAMPILWALLAVLLVRRGEAALSRGGWALLAVLAYALITEAVSGSFWPSRIYTSSALQHAGAFGLFGWLASERERRRSSALIGLAGGFVQGVLFGWAPIAWGYFLGGGGPGADRLVYIGFFISDGLPYMLPIVNLWAMALIAAAVVAWGRSRDRLTRFGAALAPAAGIMCVESIAPRALSYVQAVVGNSAPSRIMLVAAACLVCAEFVPELFARMRRR